MLSKHVTDLNRADIQQLIDDAVIERQHIDYKGYTSQQNMSTPHAKDEFRPDVSSFAKASVGDLVVGVSEKDGVPTAVLGMELPDGQDRFKLRLEDLLQTHIRPRIPGVVIHPIEVEKGRWVIVVRVPRSFNAPHQVQIDRNDFQFWARNSGGKYRLDVDQLRSAFVASEGLADRIRSFRADRLARLVAGITPVPLVDGPRLVLYVVPMATFAEGKLDLSELERIAIQDPKIVWPLPFDGSSSEWHLSWRYNLDGFVSFHARNAPSSSYLQVFRNGTLEAVRAFPPMQSAIDQPTLYMGMCEEIVLEALPGFRGLQERIRAVGPTVALLSIVGVKGRSILVPTRMGYRTGHAIDEDVVMTPDVILEGDLDRSLRPAFDVVWQAAGFPCSQTYDARGARKPPIL